MTNQQTDEYIINANRVGLPSIYRLGDIGDRIFICSCNEYHVALALCKLLNDTRTVIT